MTRKSVAGQDVLLEIGTEELPASVVPVALTSMKESVTRLFKEARLAHGLVKTVGTARRLALWVQEVAERQEPVTTDAMGPSRAVGFDAQGQPTRAAIGFAASQGVGVTALVTKTMPKGEYLFAVKQDAGRKTSLLLPALLAELVGGLTFQKAMRWNDTGVRFARPVRWLLALYGGKPIRFQFAGVTSGNQTYGHRAHSSGRPLRVKDCRAYETSLKKSGVIVDPEMRRALILAQMQRLAKTKKGCLHEDEALLEQAVFSVERPTVLLGSFNPESLALPQAVLMTAMKEHQGYFSLLAKDGGLLPHFIAVVNMTDSRTGTIRAGNERVLAARLSDAKFFFDEDRKIRLESRLEKLKGVTFHQKLGTLSQKVERVTVLAAKLAETLGDRQTIAHCRQAATLSKADLVTGMVGEFPTLQGIMGREYALHDGAPKAVADAIAEQYLPRFAEDAIPPSLAGKILSLADRLDTLAAFFAAGLVPSGSEDPFALRRHAYAVVRILVEGGLSVNVRAAIDDAVRLVQAQGQGLVAGDKAPADLQRFIGERLRHYCQDVINLRGDLVEAVLSGQDGEFDPLDVVARARALHTFAERLEFQALVITFKRVDNIAKAHETDGVNPSLFQDAAETGLSMSLGAAEESMPGLIESRTYGAALDAMAALKAPIDAFFLSVMVMVEDEALRDNRLALLVRTRKLFLRYADFSQIRIDLKISVLLQ